MWLAEPLLGIVLQRLHVEPVVVNDSLEIIGEVHRRKDIFHTISSPDFQQEKVFFKIQNQQIQVTTKKNRFTGENRLIWTPKMATSTMADLVKMATC